MLRRVITVSLFATICGVTPGWSASGQNGREAAKPTQTEALPIVQRIGLLLPPTTSVEYAEEITGRDDAARLIVVLSETEWQQLQRSFLLSAASQLPFTAEANFHLGPDEGTWAPSRVERLQTVQLPWRDGMEALNLGIARAGNGRIRLFVFWHQL